MSPYGFLLYIKLYERTINPFLKVNLNQIINSHFSAEPIHTHSVIVQASSFRPLVEDTKTIYRRAWDITEQKLAEMIIINRNLSVQSLKR